MSRSRAIGTRGEVEVVKAFHRAGLPAHRTALAGHLDVGDVHALDGRIVIECKAGEATRKPSWPRLLAWLAETETEAGRVLTCDLALLVTRRWGSGHAEDWHAWTHLDDLAALLTPGADLDLPHLPVAVRLGDLLSQLPARPADRTHVARRGHVPPTHPGLAQQPQSGESEATAAIVGTLPGASLQGIDAEPGS